MSTGRKDVEWAVIAELDPIQFAYKARKRFDDVVVTLINLEVTTKQAKLLLIDFLQFLHIDCCQNFTWILTLFAG